jgi:hypothetical protein
MANLPVRLPAAAFSVASRVLKPDRACACFREEAVTLTN